ncbi:hypothetical protein [Anaerobacillus alkaliphilus]|nr:hypothetical protein [Anaerobacillus alkaliphilus]
MDKKTQTEKNEEIKKDPHNIEISETGYGYVPMDSEVENIKIDELEK